MHLLNTRTLKLIEFYADIPPYAILSHTWDKDEVTYQDIQNIDNAKCKAGFQKVLKACVHAQSYNFEWIWIDSCCINKQSSAELSEAINSMYRYYEDAEVCYVYLSEARYDEDPRNIDSSFRTCRWFTRGWTLQELLAPFYVVFLDMDWIEIGTRWGLRDVISAITSIPVKVFENGDIDQFSVAQKMSWAALRKTTRPEDHAYCLMGIFGVNMPPIYGEGGEKAFMRLQQEIIKISDDRSIFAWIAAPGETELRGLLARSPFEFRMSGEVGRSESDTIGSKSSYSFGNNGLHIHLPLVPLDSNSENGPFLAYLHCRSEKDDSYCSIFLQKTHDRQYARCHAEKLALDLTLADSLQTIHDIVVKENPTVKRKSKGPVWGAKYDLQIRLHPTAQPYLTNVLQLWDYVHIPYTQQSVFHVTCFALVRKSMDLNREEEELIHIIVGDDAPFFDVLCIDSEVRASQALLFNYCQSRKMPWANCADATSRFMRSGALVSVTTQMTGNPMEKIVTIAYIPKHNGSDNLSSIEQLQPPKHGFLVPSKSASRVTGNVALHFALQDVFPQDFYRKDCGEQTYVAFFDPGGASTRTTPTFLVVSYIVTQQKSVDQLQYWFRLYVIMGILDEHVAWTDIITKEVDTPAKEIWKSYLAQLRSNFRQRCAYQSSASVKHNTRRWFRGPTSCTIIANIGQRTTLQLGSHVLDLQFSYQA